MSTALTTRPEMGFLVIDTFEQAQKVAEYINKSALVPDAYRGKPADIVIAMQYGMELGLSPMQSLQSVAVINGKPSIYGDALPAVVMLHPDFEDMDAPEPTGSNPEEWVAPCTVKRRGRAPVLRTFSTADAKAAGLWKKAGPWTNYPKRMLMMRARAFALRDAFPDRMKGITTVEEAIDITPERVAPSEPRRLSESAPPPPTDAPAGVAAGDGPPTAMAAAPAAPAASGKQTTGVRIEDTKFSVDPKTNQQTYEIYTKKNGVAVTFITHERTLYDSAASCEGTDHLFTITYVRGRHNDQPALIMTGITLEEQVDATPNDGGAPAQPALPTEGV